MGTTLITRKMRSLDFGYSETSDPDKWHAAKWFEHLTVRMVLEHHEVVARDFEGTDWTWGIRVHGLEVVGSRPELLCELRDLHNKLIHSMLVDLEGPPRPPLGARFGAHWAHVRIGGGIPESLTLPPPCPKCVADLAYYFRGYLTSWIPSCRGQRGKELTRRLDALQRLIEKSCCCPPPAPAPLPPPESAWWGAIVDDLAAKGVHVVLRDDPVKK